MSGFFELLRREWREARALVLAGFAIGPLLVGLVQATLAPELPADLLEVVLPAAVGLFLVVLAADATAREAEDGTGELLARLPLPARLAWLARALFLAAAGVAFMAWLFAAESLRRQLAGVDPLPLRLGAWIRYAPLAMAAVAATACIAALSRRSFASALAGLGLVLGPCLLVLPGPLDPYVELVRAAWRPGAFAALAAATLLVASFASYSPRAGALARTGRRALAALGTFALVAVPSLAWTVWRADRLLDCVPGSNAGIGAPCLSPDGRYVALLATRRLDELVHYETWILDREERDVVRLEGWRNHVPHVPVGYGFIGSPWGTDGLLRVRSASFTQNAWGQDVSVLTVEPAGGAVVARAPATEVEPIEREMGFPRWYRLHEGDRMIVELRADGSRHALPGGRLLALSPVEPVAFLERAPGALSRCELPGASERALLVLDGSIERVNVSPDGARLAVRTSNELVIADARTGELAYRGPVTYPHWTSERGHGVLILRGHPLKPLLVGETDVREVPWILVGCRELPEGGFLRVTVDGRVVELESDGRERRVLLEAPNRQERR